VVLYGCGDVAVFNTMRRSRETENRMIAATPRPKNPRPLNRNRSELCTVGSMYKQIGSDTEGT